MAYLHLRLAAVSLDKYRLRNNSRLSWPPRYVVTARDRATSSRACYNVDVLFLSLSLSVFPPDTVKGDNNDNCCNSSPCPELTSNPKSIENSATDTKESTMECENIVDNSQDTAATTLQEASTENIDFTVIYNKQKISVNFALDGTVAELKMHLQKIISVPQAMQKVMFKGLAKDDQTLRNLGVTKGNNQLRHIFENLISPNVLQLYKLFVILCD